MAPAGARGAAVVAAMALLGACEIAEVEAPRSDDVLVVEAILRAGDPRQQIMLHRGLGVGDPAEPIDADVRVTTPSGRIVRFSLDPRARCAALDTSFRLGDDSLRIVPTCYVSGADEGRWVTPGATYALRVATPDGREGHGATTVPRAFGLRAPSLGEGTSCSLPPATPLPLVWSRAEGAAGYVIQMEVSGLRAVLGGPPERVPEPLTLFGIAASAADTMILAPAQIGAFDRFRYDPPVLLALRDGFPAGTAATFTVAAVDPNYVNSVRGGPFNPSGPTRISSVHGDAVGVFGSMVPRTFTVSASDAEGVRRCLGP